jgi:hypothetical protein
MSLAVPLMAQVTAPPPAVPNVVPATPQPGIASGASGGIGTQVTGRPAPGNLGPVPTVPGRPTLAPPPVLMTTEQLRPENYDPFFVPGLFPVYPYVEPPPAPIVGQGRPGGLGVTITGGSTNPPPAVSTPTPAVTNAVTNGLNGVFPGQVSPGQPANVAPATPNPPAGYYP